MKKMNKSLGIALVALTLLTTACSKEEVKEDATTAKNEVTNVAKDVKNEATDLKDDAEDEIHELTGKYEGEKGTYNISDVKTLDGKSGSKVIAITLEYTNTTSENQNPLVAFQSDMTIEQLVDDKPELLQSALQDLPEDYKVEDVKNTNLEVEAGKSSNVVFAFTVLNPDEKVILKDTKTEGTDFSREYSVL